MKKSTGLKIVGIATVLAFALCLMYLNFLAKPVSSKLYNTNLKNTTATIDAIQAKVGEYETTNINIKAQFATMNNDYKALNTKIDAINLSSYAKASDLKALQDGITTLAANVANVANNSTITDLKSQIKTLNDANTQQDTKIQVATDKNTSQDTRLATLEDQVKKLQATPTPTTTPTTTTTTADGNRVIATSTKEFITAKLLSYYSYGYDYGSLYYGSIVAGNKVSKKMTARFESTATSTTADGIAFTIALYIEDLSDNFKWSNFSIKAYRSQMTVVDGGTTGDDYCVFLYEPSSTSYSNIKVEPTETKEVTITLTYDNSSGTTTVSGFTVYLEDFILENIRN